MAPNSARVKRARSPKTVVFATNARSAGLAASVVQRVILVSMKSGALSHPVSVFSTKWNGDFHRRTPCFELGSDEFGTWLWMPPGTIVETRSGPFEGIPGLRLIPIGQMWSAYFVPSAPPVCQPGSTYVDITTTTRRIGDCFEFVDLDLDVEVVGAGPVAVLDRDEFVDHARVWGYPDETMTAAETTCRDVVELLTNHQPPFDGSYLRWWSLVDTDGKG